MITESLSEALRQLRRTQQHQDDISGLWWVDMLCIDQQCIPERNHQVAMMRDIFQSATLMVAWFGTDRWFEPGIFANSMLQAPAQASGYLGTVDHSDRAETRPTLPDASEFLNRPYWGCVWIIQELCVASDILIMSGCHCISCSSFRLDLRERIQPTAGFPVPMVLADTKGTMSADSVRYTTPYKLVTLRDKILSGGGKCKLGLLLYFASESKANDPRDRVYSLLGLANDVSGDDIPPDYSLSPCTVYCAATRVIYKSLCIGDSDFRSAITGLASWCSHDPLFGADERRGHCDGLDCHAWWCCRDRAFVHSRSQSTRYVDRDLLGYIDFATKILEPTIQVKKQVAVMKALFCITTLCSVQANETENIRV